MLDAASTLTKTVAMREAADTLLPAEVRGLVLEVNGKRLINGIDLTLQPGSLTVIMGPNGAGKSLLLRLLHGLVRPTSGHVLWAGMPIDETVRKRQAMVFQTPVLLRRSVAANIDFVLKLRAAGARRDEVLDMCGLAAHAGQPARLLSGGERQRLAVARALALDPQVLFLDEPTVSLDPASVFAIEEIVRAARDRGTKVVFVTHDVGQAKRLADEVVFMHKGRVMEHSPAETYFDAPSSNEAEDYLAGRIVL